jgi:NADH:ubiquinone oxidoreductase subunit 6 (subunit J)
MTLVLALLSVLILGVAAVAMALRNLIHTALLLVATWAGIAAVYLWAGAEFVAFAQMLVYVGAVSMVVLFAVLLTRRSDGDPVVAAGSRNRAVAGILTGGLVTAVLVGAVMTSSLAPAVGRAPAVSVRQLGFQLMNQHAASLLVVGVILTVALIGATVIASTERSGEVDEAGNGTSPEDRP